MKSILSNVYWGWLANNAVKNMYIWELLDVLKKYDKIQEIPTDDSITALVPNKPDGDDDFVVYCNTYRTIYDIYYKNIHMQIVDTPTHEIFQIFLKTEDDIWIINRNSEGIFDVSNPNTKTVEVYYWFDIETMHENRCSDEKYMKGTWNEYIFKTLSDFENKVINLTVEFQISDAYKNFKTE